MAVAALQHPRVYDLVAELMTRDEPAFIPQRVENFFNTLEAEGFRIIRFVKSERPAIQFEPD